MHDLEKQINEWRKTLKVSATAREELEGHLRESVMRLQKEGVEEGEIFERAVAGLGKRRRFRRSIENLSAQLGGLHRRRVG